MIRKLHIQRDLSLRILFPSKIVEGFERLLGSTHPAVQRISFMGFINDSQMPIL